MDAPAPPIIAAGGAPVIQLENLAKNYGDFRAVADLNLTVGRGEVFGFLGPNGAGKTTTIKMLMGILVPSGGAARICNLDCFADRVATKRVTGYLPDNPVFYDYLRGNEILRFVGEMHGLTGDRLQQREQQLLKELALDEAEDDYAVNYSTGMKKKLGLACALIHEPQVLILDEPTNGLDPRASRHIQDLIRLIAQQGRTVFLSTHLLNMAENLCHRVGIIDRGKLVAVGTPQELRMKVCAGGSLEEVFFATTASEDAAPASVPATANVPETRA